MKIRYLTYILMPVAILMAFLIAPPAAILGEGSRILYFHVPMAWVSVLAFLVSGVMSVMYLAKGGVESIRGLDAALAAELGIIFTVLTIITGSFWAHLSWGSYWNWDPRETSIVVLFLIYMAYFSLRTVLRENDNRDRISSVYLVMAAVSVPFFVFVIPRVYPSLHPDPLINAERKVNMDATMLATLLVAIVAFSLLFLYLMDLYRRAERLGKILRDREEKF
jgi:heme exporter protein C